MLQDWNVVSNYTETDKDCHKHSHSSLPGKVGESILSTFTFLSTRGWGCLNFRYPWNMLTPYQMKSNIFGISKVC